jgi:hypothetical protein
MATDRPNGEFYDFYVSPEYLDISSSNFTFSCNVSLISYSFAEKLRIATI